MKLLKNNVLSLLLLLFSATASSGERIVFVPDLAKITQPAEWTVHNRTATFIKDQQQGSVSFDAQPEAGIAWLKNNLIGSENLTIEVDLKGSDEKDKSYLGIAFNGQDEKNYEAVYFRPFNFNAADPMRKSHAVQYIAEPDHPWEQLRKDQPGSYENAISPPVNPNEFFHLKMILNKQQLRVFVNNATEPTLTVERLTADKTGWIGFWMGKNSAGAFKNLTIAPAIQ